MNRLKKEGFIERMGWGKYKLKLSHSADDKKLKEIGDNFTDITEEILGNSESNNGIERSDDPFLYLVDIYSAVSVIGGETMARNLLRLSANKDLPPEEVDALIISVSEVVSQ